MAVEQLVHYFQQQVYRGTLSHAYLFSGSDYPGKKKLTQAILQALVCQQPTVVNQPCLQCELCERIEKEQFADTMVIRPDGQGVKVDQIRQLKEWLGKTPIEANFKLAVIEKAESMNVSAANALLTFLEEPVANVYMILYVNDADTVLPTIRSRTQQIHLNGLQTEQRIVELEARGILPHHARVISYFNNDSIQQWCEHYEANVFEQWHKSLRLFYRKLLQGDTSAFVTVQTHLKAYLSTQQGLDGLDYYLVITNQLLKALQSQQTSVAYLEELIQECQPTVSRLLAMHRILLEAKKRLSANVSAQMCYEYLAIELSAWR
ncbi:hypothetical protein NHG28_07180 [Aerococcaceae bacterium NML201209]|nr:hypothetical protein [Aerococcaceae bacterium NML201209]